MAKAVSAKVSSPSTLSSILKDKGIAHVAIDSDNENSTLKRFHPDTRFLDLGNRRELDGIFAALEKSNLVVMDCRAASTDLFIDFFTEIDLPAVLSAMGAALTLVMPVNHESDSVDQVQRLADQFGKKCNYVVVRNAAHSDSFALFESSRSAGATQRQTRRTGNRHVPIAGLAGRGAQRRKPDHHGSNQTSLLQPAGPATTPNLAAETLRRNRIRRRPASALKVMAMPSTQQPDFDEEFAKAVAEWRDKHRLREDDAVTLLVELFRIHQQHWDELRRREIPSFEQFRADITKLLGAAQTFQQQSSALLELLRSQPPAHRAARITRAAAIFAALAALLAGYLIGRAWR